MWQPSSYSKQYQKEDLIDLLYDLGDDEELTFFDKKNDEFEVVPGSSDEIVSSQIINIFIPSGTQTFLDLKAGADNLRLCFK